MDGTAQGLETTSGTIYSLANVLALDCVHGFGWNPGPDQIVISDISLSPSSLISLAKFDVLHDIQQDGAVISPDTGLLQVRPDLPMTVIVHVIGNSVSSTDTRSVTLTLQAGQQAPQTRVISLASVAQAPGQVLQVPFMVSFDSKTEGGMQTITATVDPGNTLQQSDTSQNTQSVQLNVKVPELSISSPQLTQAVNDFKLPGSPADVDLVRGKSTAAIFDVGVKNALATDTTPVTFTIDLGDGTGPVAMTPITPSAPITLGSIVSHGGSQQVTLAPILPKVASGAGTFTVAFKASADGAKDGKAPMTVRVKETAPLGIDFFPMTNRDEDVPATDFAKHVGIADALFTGMYPIAEQGLSASDGDDISSAPYHASQTDLGAIQQDLATLSIAGALKNPASQVGIGIVSDNYFADRGLGAGTRGIAQTPQGGCQTALGTKGAIVEVGFYDTTQHETAHTFGLLHAFGAPSVNGFWVDSGRALTGLIDLMDYTNETAFSPLVPYRWISSSEYQCIFQQLLAVQGDPSVILVAGFLNQAGTVTLLSTRYLSNGTATPFNSTAEGAVQLLDSSGNIVSQGSFVPSFSLLNDAGSIFPTSSSFFLVQLPVSQSAETVQISQGGKVVSRFNPSSQLLSDAVNSLPDSSFINERRARTSRKAILEQIQRIDWMLMHCEKEKVKFHFDDRDETACISGVLGMMDELRKRLDREVSDSVGTESPIQMTKSQVISTLDFVLLQTIPDRIVRAKGHAFRIHVVPDEFRQLISVSSVSQGRYGSVEILKNGRLLYVPYSHERRADSFDVTLTDTEGAMLRKTVTIIAPPRGDYDGDETQDIIRSIEQIIRHQAGSKR